MPAQILDGAALARTLRYATAQRAAHLATQGVTPGLAVVLVGTDPASQVYVRNKVKACADAGIRSWLEQMPAESTEQAILEVIELFNQDPAVHGILVQLPLPRSIDPRKILEAIDPLKDVDGLQTHSAGALVTGQAGFLPCTPFGILKMLEHVKATIAGSQAVVVGRSVSVGKPMGLLLLERDATVTFCHSKTHQLANITRGADILIAAVGRAAMITGDMVKPGAIVIDVGINRGADGKLYGDIEIETVREVASWVSPVPGGVGPMTITMLLENTVLAAQSALHRS